MNSDENDQQGCLSDLEPFDRGSGARRIERAAQALWDARVKLWRVGLVVGGLWLLWLTLIPAHLEQHTSTSASFKAKAIPCWSSEASSAPHAQAPVGLAVNSQGVVYEADMGRDRVQGFDSQGQIRLSWGCLGKAQGQFDLGLNEGAGIAVDYAGNVYVADADNARIQRFGGKGHFLSFWSSPFPQLFYPVAVAVDRQEDVYVADFDNARILKFDSAGHFLLSWGSPGRKNGQFVLPDGIAVDGEGDVYVADRENARIEKFDGKGHFLLSWGSHGQQDGQFAVPVGIAFDGQDHIYVADRDNGRVEMFTSDGQFLRKWDHLRSKDGQGIALIGVAVSADGSIYVIAQDTECIQKLSSFGDSVVDWTC